MDYPILSKLYYQSKELYEETYEKRFNSEYATHLNFDIKGAKAFFVKTPEIYGELAEVLRINHAVSNLCSLLPGAAIDQFFRRCLIDEIVLTNSIEGVRSTRKEISDILDELEEKSKGQRFYGLVHKYYMLMMKEELSLGSCEDVRKIYDELVLPEIIEEDPDNAPDGKWFRKGPVSVYSPSQKEIHKGLYPEETIIEAIENAIEFLEDDSCDILFRISIFHYLIEYIHPFYDGNGRLGRFICSYLLSQSLEPVTAYRISYTIKEMLKEYYQAFSICNDPLNKGDLTPFLIMFLRVIKTSVKKLKESLQQGYVRFNRCRSKIGDLFPATESVLAELCDLLIQATLFSEIGVSTKTIMRHIGISRGTLNKNLEKIPADLLRKEPRGRTNYYLLDLERFEEL